MPGLMGKATGGRYEYLIMTSKASPACTVLTQLREIVVQLARDPVEGGLGRPVGDVVDVEQAADLDAADHGGDGDEFGGRAGLEDGPNRLEEH